MISTIDAILYVAICFIATVGTRIWLAIEQYLAEKAKNLAAIQDVGKITAETEAVQAEFHKTTGKFDADLAFKYRFYEKQYNELYSKLYQKICESEGLRYILNNLVGEHMNYSDFPIVEFASEIEENPGQTYGDSTIDQILKLISTNYIYASPDLIKIVSVLENMKKYEEDLPEEIGRASCRERV